MTVYRRTGWIALIAALALVASGCSLFGSKPQSAAIDPPPVDAETMMNRAGGDGRTTGGDEALQTGAETQKTVKTTVFLEDAYGLLAPVTVAMEETVEVAKKSLERMVEDGEGAGSLPAGFRALLPKGTVVNGIDIKDKTAIVDFSQHFANYNPQDERKILEAIVWTLTGFPTIDSVKLRIDGVELTEMPQAGFPLNGPLTRAMGINIELTAGVNIGQSTPVTVYFMRKGEEGRSYYVPVTKLVQRTDDKMSAALEALVSGPSPRKGLEPVLNPHAAVNGITVSEEDQMVTVDFTGGFLGEDGNLPEEAVQAVVLSITENSDAAKVQIVVEGYDGNVFPVSRPIHVNPLML